MSAPTPAIFLLDANGFIEAHRRFYAFDICPGFWASLEHHGGWRIQSVDKVKAELLVGNDRLATWAGQPALDTIFQDTNQQDVWTAYARVMAWAQKSAQFTQSAKEEFARGADAWLVAYALAKNAIIVTQEASSPTARARVLIPNACDGLGVRYVNLFEMLRSLVVRFHWQPSEANTAP